MCATCKHVTHMPKMIQIRHVPEALHRALRARAARAGMTLSDYLRAELARAAEQLTPEELRERLPPPQPGALPQPPTPPPPAASPQLARSGASETASDRHRRVGGSRASAPDPGVTGDRGPPFGFGRDAPRSTSARCRSGSSAPAVCCSE